MNPDMKTHPKAGPLGSPRTLREAWIALAGPDLSFSAWRASRPRLSRAAWLSAVAVVFGLAVYALLGSFGYLWIAIALVLVAAGLRVVGVVAATNVLRGLPRNRTTIGAALADTATEVASALGPALTGTIIAALFTGEIASASWSPRQRSEFREAVTIAGLGLTLVAAALVA